MTDIDLDFIVKLGGSCITVKDGFEIARLNNIKKLAETFLKCHEKKMKFIIIHGAGSYGHKTAKQYNIQKGIIDHSSCIGFARTRGSVMKLNSIVIDEFTNIGIPAVSVPGCSNWLMSNGIPDDSHLPVYSHVKLLIETGFVPVLFGDAVLDSVRGCSILGGDTIMQLFADVMKPRRIVYLSDVAGVLRNPDEKSSVIERMTRDDLSKINTRVNTEHDVTGGMLAKVQCALSIAGNRNDGGGVTICHMDSAEDVLLDGLSRGTLVL